MITKTSKSKSEYVAFIMSECAIATFLVFLIIDSLAKENIRELIGSIGSCIVVALALALCHQLRHYIDISFYMPLTLFVVFTAANFIIRTFVVYFPVCLGLCCIAALYLNPRSLGKYLFITNIIYLFLLYFKVPMSHDSRIIEFTEMLLLWFVTLMSSIFVYVVTAFAADKNNSANRAQDSFIALLSSTANRIVLVDSLNRVTYISKSFMDLTNLSARSMTTGRPVLDLFPDPHIRDIFYQILTAEGFCKSTQEITVNGQQHYFEIISVALKGDIEGRLINIIDITPVMKAKFEAEAASESKSSFLATMSHEIRTPLNAIIGLSEIELQKKLPLETRLDLEKIHTSGASLLAIINDILDISKIESGSFELIPVDYDVPGMVNDTIHLNIVRIGSKNIVFKLDIDPAIPRKLHGDEVRVKQVLNNLLSNAFKYTEEGNVGLHIAWEGQEDMAWISFTVSDTGRGIRQEDLSRLFSEYSQLDTRANRHIEGTGLGLSITRNLVELMGGAISVESEYGKGSAFRVRVPQQIVDRTPIGEATAQNLRLLQFMETRRNRKLNLARAYMPYGRVLVVDDVETNLDVARGLMLPYGLSIECASGGQEAIEKIRAVCADPSRPRYDLILMDHMMPMMDGIEAVRIIRTEIDDDYARKVPIVALTANALAGNEEMFLSHGFSAFISKPVDIMQLDRVLNTWVRDKQDQETLLRAARKQAAQTETAAGAVPGILEHWRLEGIDLLRGKERYQNEGTYLNILRSYATHTPPLLERLNEWGRDRGTGISLSEYTVAVHGLKGSSYGICADALGKNAEELERAARAGDRERVSSGNGPFIEKSRRLLRDLDELLEKAAAGEPEKWRAEKPDSELLEQLLGAVKRYKTRTMEEVLGELESFEYQSGGELVVWLREQMDNLEYDAIRRRLENPEPAAAETGAAPRDRDV